MTHFQTELLAVLTRIAVAQESIAASAICLAKPLVEVRGSSLDITELVGCEPPARRQAGHDAEALAGQGGGAGSAPPPPDPDGRDTSAGAPPRGARPHGEAGRTRPGAGESHASQNALPSSGEVLAPERLLSESPQLRRARELLGMGAHRNDVLQAVRLTKAEKAALQAVV
jgi:hypothetical protein